MSSGFGRYAFFQKSAWRRRAGAGTSTLPSWASHRITVMVADKPAWAGIDPRNLLIEVEGDDNLEEITRPEGQKAERVQ